MNYSPIKKNLTFLFTGLISVCIFLSCAKNVSEGIEIVQTEDHVVTLSMAKKIAEKHSGSDRWYDDLKMSSKSSKERKSRKAAGSLSMKKDELNATYHIINMEQRGYVIVSGDNRIYPILAYSAEGRFDLSDTASYHPGLKEWLTYIHEEVKVVRNENAEQSPMALAAWRSFQSGEGIIPIEGQNFNFLDSVEINPIDLPQEGCPIVGQQIALIFKRGPFVTSRWGQGAGFNNTLPNWGCPENGGRPVTGCVATALSEVMRYHQKPATYNWGAMPNAGGNNIVSQLMEDVGHAVSMNWGCAESGATISNAVQGLKNFGYTSATSMDLNTNTLRTQLSAKRPVLLTGSGPTGAHMWVADGVQTATSFTCEDSGFETMPPYWQHYGISGTYVHCNWGWTGINNGWFWMGSWTPDTHSFMNNRKMITNIF